MRPEFRRRTTPGASHRWWPPLLLTALALASLNLLLAYLVALALWPGRVPLVESLALVALALVGVVCGFLAARGWNSYLRSGRRPR